VNGRLLSGFIAMLVLTPVAVGLLVVETPAPPAKVVAEAATEVDKLSGLVYVPATREENLRKMGLKDAQVEGVKKEIEARSRRWKTDDVTASDLTRLIQVTEDAQLLEDSLCGRETPARYSALRILVEDGTKGLEVRALENLPRLEAADWYDKERPARLAAELDIVPNREPDALPMALAAVFARQVTPALDHQSPWGRSVLDSWNWDSVLKKWPEVEGKIDRYLATFILVMENVTADDGFCRTQ
jgi:hypothetical protein